MNAERFEKILEAQFDSSRKLLLAKRDEYASDADRLHNFRVAAAMTGTTVADAALGMALKHFVSVVDIIKRSAATGNVPPDSVLEEKFTDSVNYLALMRAALIEQREEGGKS